MQPLCKRRALVAAIASLLAVGAGASDAAGPFLPNMLPIPNATGVAATFSTEGRIGLRGPFFQSLGTNGRACVSCHQPQAGWTITPRERRAPLRPHPRHRSDLPHQRRLEFARRRRVHGGRASRRLQHAAEQRR